MARALWDLFVCLESGRRASEGEGFVGFGIFESVRARDLRDFLFVLKVGE